MRGGQDFLPPGDELLLAWSELAMQGTQKIEEPWRQIPRGIKARRG